MATFTFFQDFAEQIGKEQHQLSSDTFKWVLTNTAPNAGTNTVLTDITQITGANGYTTGGAAVTHTFTESAGTGTFNVSGDVTWTATGGSIADFRYAVLYNDTNATDMLVGYIDHGSTVSLATGQSYTISSGNVFTIAIP